MSESEAPVREGDVIAGKYRVERVLGKGGMGVVVAAMHVELEQRVALKFLLPEAAAHPDVAARFAREARAAARIHSEHVARVIDVGTLPTGAPYMVMEYMDGEDLEHVLARVGPLPFDAATSYVLQACEALAEAHVLGIIHRDLKPANLFLARRRNGDPIVKVLDFGISKSTQSTTGAQLTKTSSIMGSPLYMSPEQMTSAKSVDVRSDVWALGALLYELLAGRPPFLAETMPELIAAILQAPPDPIRAHRADVPPALEAVIHRCLEKSRALRFANVAELARALVPFGPARSEVSVERISHVLGDGSAAAASLGTAATAHAAMAPTAIPRTVDDPAVVGTTAYVPPGPLPPPVAAPPAPLRPIDPWPEREVTERMPPGEAVALRLKPLVGGSTTAQPVSSTPSSAESAAAGVPRKGGLARGLVAAGLVFVIGSGVAAYRVFGSGPVPVPAIPPPPDTPSTEAWTVVPPPPVPPSYASATKEARDAASTPPPVVHHPPALPLPQFDRDAAAVALGRVSLEGCNAPGGPTGPGHVSISFMPSGAVESVSADQPPNCSRLQLERT